MTSHNTLVERLRYLVSLNEPENGGPYAGYAATQCIEAMREAAAELTRLQSLASAEPVAWKRTEKPISRQFTLRPEVTLDAELAEMWRQSPHTESLTPLYATPPASASAGEVERPLRLCGYCKSWNSKPCGEQCVWTPDMPTLAALTALPATPAVEITEDMVEALMTSILEQIRRPDLRYYKPWFEQAVFEGVDIRAALAAALSGKG